MYIRVECGWPQARDPSVAHARALRKHFAPGLLFITEQNAFWDGVRLTRDPCVARVISCSLSKRNTVVLRATLLRDYNVFGGFRRHA